MGQRRRRHQQLHEVKEVGAQRIGDLLGQRDRARLGRRKSEAGVA